MNRFMPNTVISTKGTENSFKWNKNPESIITWLRSFQAKIVIDFFCGEGTIPTTCKMLSRYWLAFEIESDIAERARQRIIQTQPPLFTLEPEQLEFSV